MTLSIRRRIPGPAASGRYSCRDVRPHPGPAAGIGGAAARPGQGPLIAKVNGTEIHQSDWRLAEERPGRSADGAGAKQDYLVAVHADMILVSKAAEAKHLGDGADFKRKLAFNRNKLLMEALLLSVGKEALTDDRNAQGL